MDRDAYRAFKHFQESADIFDGKGQFELAQCYWNGTGVREDGERALNYYWKAAGNGCQDALSMLAVLHCQGHFETEDRDQSVGRLQSCPNSECTSCKLILGIMLVQNDEEQAYKLFHEAENSGNTSAMLLLAGCLLEGRAVTCNHEKAFSLIKEASVSIPEANIFVGYCLEHGLGVTECSEEAIASYQKGFGAEENV